MDAKATDSFRDRNLSVNYSCSYFSNLIGRRTINIPEIILGVHGLMGFTVKDRKKTQNEGMPTMAGSVLCLNNQSIAKY